MSRNLFRKEAINAQVLRANGEPAFQYPIGVRTLTIFSLVCTLAFILFIFCFDFTQKEVASGYLEPERGLIAIYPEQSGVLISAAPSLGQSVRKGQSLVMIRSQPQQIDAGTLPTVSLHAMQERINSLKASIQRQNQITSEARSAKWREQVALELVIANLDLKLNSASEQIRIQRALLERGEKLVREHFVTDDFIDQRRLAVSESEGRKYDLESELAKMKRDHVTVLADLEMLKLRGVESVQAIARELLTIQGNLSDRKNPREFNVIAPIDGVISAVNKQPGQYVEKNMSVITIIPGNSELRGVLLLPARAVAFVKLNQSVSLRYAGFPYQYFGSFPAVVSAIESVPTKINGSGESTVYRVYVRIPQQKVATATGPRSLTAGMPIDGHIRLSQRSLVDWIFTPALQFFSRNKWELPR